MSGGSYGYLCDTWELEQLTRRQGSLEAMAARLAGLGYAKDAAAETLELLLALRQFEINAMVRIDRLKGVWKAVEWWDSNDYSEDQVREALEEYRAHQLGGAQ
jgi:hypothetical protein